MIRIMSERRYNEELDKAKAEVVERQTRLERMERIYERFNRIEDRLYRLEHPGEEPEPRGIVANRPCEY